MPSRIDEIRTLLFDPDAFFRDRVDDPSLIGPLVVVTVIAVLTALAAVAQNQVLVSVLEAAFEEAGTDGANGTATDDGVPDIAIQVFLIVTYATSMVGPYVTWVLFAAAFHAISVLFDGKNNFSTTMAVVGWGRFPAIFGSLGSLAINVYQFQIQGVDIPETVTGANVQRLVRDLQQPELVILNAALSVVFTLWAAYIWVYGLKHARELTRRQATLTVVVPILASLAFTLRNVLFVL